MLKGLSQVDPAEDGLYFTSVEGWNHEMHHIYVVYLGSKADVFITNPEYFDAEGDHWDTTQ